MCSSAVCGKHKFPIYKYAYRALYGYMVYVNLKKYLFLLCCKWSYINVRYCKVFICYRYLCKVSIPEVWVHINNLVKWALQNVKPWFTITFRPSRMSHCRWHMAPLFELFSIFYFDYFFWVDWICESPFLYKYIYVNIFIHIAKHKYLCIYKSIYAYVEMFIFLRWAWQNLLLLFPWMNVTFVYQWLIAESLWKALGAARTHI